MPTPRHLSNGLGLEGAMVVSNIHILTATLAVEVWIFEIVGLGCYVLLECLIWWGCEAVLVRKRPRDCGLQIAGTKGLISVDRRTSLLSYLQYPVPYQSRLQRIYRSQCPKGD